MPTTKTGARKTTLTRKRAKVAVKMARNRYDKKSSKRSATWKKGGNQWSRFLGHFGIAE